MVTHTANPCTETQNDIFVQTRVLRTVLHKNELIYFKMIVFGFVSKTCFTGTTALFLKTMIHEKSNPLQMRSIDQSQA